MQELLIFIAGAFMGATGIFTLFFWLGTSKRFEQYDIKNNERLYYHANFKAECDAEGHKWCSDPNCRIKYHCTRCGHTLEQ